MLTDHTIKPPELIPIDSIRPGEIFKLSGSDQFYTIVLTVLGDRMLLLVPYNHTLLGKVYPDACLRINYGFVDNQKKPKD